MKVCKNVEEFYYINDKDLTNILVKLFKNTLQNIPLEDLKSEIYLRLHSKKYIENFRPLDIRIDDLDRTWMIKPSHAKMSTYVCKFVFNYIYAYHKNIDPDDLCESLDGRDDSGYSIINDGTTRYLHKDKNEETMNKLNFKLELEKYMDDLEEKTKHKGALVCDSAQEESIVRILDTFGEKGCEEDTLLNLVSNGIIDSEINNSFISLLKDQIESVTLSLEKKGAIKSDVSDGGTKKFYISNPERRSTYNLLKHYMMGYKDKEISQKFKMSVAGIGAMKRILRKEIKEIKEEI